MVSCVAALAHSSGSQTPTIASKSPVYEVASIRENRSPNPTWRMKFTPVGLTATAVTLQYAIREAYGVNDDKLWSGGPTWLDERRFDIEAKFDVSEFQNPTLEERRIMLRGLLAKRFRLTVHREPKEFPLYALVLAPKGPKLLESNPGTTIKGGVYGAMCSIVHSHAGTLEMNGCNMSDLASYLTSEASSDLGRTVVDQTGLTDRYRFKLTWSTDQPPPTNPTESSAPSIFTAIEEQLGLKLKAIEGSLQTIVIDRVELPSEN